MKIRWLLAVLAITVVQSFYACAEGDEPNSTKIESGDDVLKDTKIAVVRENGKEAVIYMISADGTNSVQLTHDHPGLQTGRKIAFNHKGEIYVMKANGTNQTRIAEGDFPVWSPFLR